MPQLEIGATDLKKLAFQLPPREFLALVAAFEDRAETLLMMSLADSAFQEWNEEGEDIYDAEAETT